ncbi:sodium-dependent transporter [Candidatus Halobonum tyrrellensis]|uniref:Transporter n=1 Tax=Candidatus Halobonum tyrrellensis G22 TaxID=1324957 RepID=V4GTX8_9EURY|nr:sodium-dependent transporter [Candidatus Halobonum tyrrellensis]ESP88586.1 sodium-and chloride-dependent transporter [Candidatus Halobonum tyrrellensis G22]
MSDRSLLPGWAHRRVAGREQWASRIGFVMAAVGSAVGLGNLWRFPYEAATNGGAAFLVVNVVAVALIGLPAMLAEFVVGRRAQRNVVDAFREGGRAWATAGVLAAVTAFWIVSYYSVVGGWVVRYLFASPTGAYFAAPSSYFEAAAVGFDAVGYAAVFLVVTVVIVAMGIERGIELATKVMVPAILLLMVGLAAFAATLPGSGAGYAYFLEPDFGYIVDNAATLIPAAVGEVLFTLSLGAGIMITYASYVDETENLVADGAAIVVVNTLVGYLAGLIVFPLLFAQGVEPGSAGPGAIFVSIANAFRTLPAGELFGVVFYFVVLVAALSSAISLLEIPTAYFVDTTDVERPVVAAALGVGAFALAVPSALDQSLFGFFDSVASQVLLPTGLFLVTVFVGWVYGREAVAELGEGDGGTLSRAWHWYLRTVVFAAVGMTLLLSLASFAGVELL